MRRGKSTADRSLDPAKDSAVVRVNVFLPEAYDAHSLARLKADRRISIVESAATAEAVLIRSQTKIHSKFLTSAPNLKLVVTATSGFDHIDWRACVARGITVAHTPEANASSTAELALFFLMALFRGTLAQMKNASEGKWRTGLQRGDALSGRVLGIVGLGRVGSHVAKLANAFGMQILAYDPFVEPSVFDEARAERMGLMEVLRASDAITLHVPLTKKTRHLINHATLNEILPTTFLVNTCRGEVVDESEVLVALRKNRLAGVALDVLEREPPVASNEILQHPMALITPHVGAFTRQAFENASMAAVDRLDQFLNGQAVSDTLPIQAPWFRAEFP